MKKYISGFLTFLVMIGLDQWAKMLAAGTLKGSGEKKILGDVFVLQYLENHGAAFGILQGKQILLAVITGIILLAVIYLYIKTPFTRKFCIQQLMTLMLAAGAVGNMYERIVRGYVIDFLYVKLIDFPIFNIADCYVVVAAIILAVLFGFVYSEEDLEKLRYAHSKSEGKK